MVGWLARLLRRRRPVPPGEVTFLLAEGVFVAPQLGPDVEPKRVGPLSQYFAALTARPSSTGVLLGGVLGEANAYAANLAELRFCLTELLPLLQSFAGAPGRRRPVGPRDAARRLRALEKHGKELTRQLERRLAEAVDVELLAESVGAPCVLLSGLFLPLERVAAGRPTRLTVAIDGHRYRACRREARDQREVFRNLRHAAQARTQERLMADRNLAAVAEEVVREARGLLERYQPRDHASRLVFHRDPDHQLQHHRGYWLLVRGPVQRRRERSPIFVGLGIRGSTREERLAYGPHASGTPEGLWTSRGEPAWCGQLCMGSRQQYALLLSPRFSDAEAVVEWLDAGVILATGRSDYHRVWRSKLKTQAQPRREAATP